MPPCAPSAAKRPSRASSPARGASLCGAHAARNSHRNGAAAPCPAATAPRHAVRSAVSISFSRVQLPWFFLRRIETIATETPKSSQVLLSMRTQPRVQCLQGVHRAHGEAMTGPMDGACCPPQRCAAHVILWRVRRWSVSTACTAARRDPMAAAVDPAAAMRNVTMIWYRAAWLGELPAGERWDG